MTDLAIALGTLITPWDILPGASLLVRDGIIAEVVPGGTLVSSHARNVDASGWYVVPGLIDLQLNGTGGIDCMHASPEELARLCAQLPRYGCTAFLPTLVTAARQRLLAQLRALAGYLATPSRGARALGIHLEGPYLSTLYRGAHDPAWLRPFEQSEWNAFMDAADGRIVLVTVAPEGTGNERAVTVMRRSGCVVSLGHSNATYAEAVQATLHGASMITHTFNAMRPLHHREPGILGAAFDSDALITGLIPDGVHVHSAAMRALLAVKGTGRVVAVTDASWVAGLPAGDYEWEGRMIYHDGHAPRLPDGTLAGSGITADAALRVLVHDVGMTLPAAVRLFTSNVARLLSLADVGELRVGCRADMTLLDRDLRVQMTIVGGEVVYERKAGDP